MSTCNQITWVQLQTLPLSMHVVNVKHLTFMIYTSRKWGQQWLPEIIQILVNTKEHMCKNDFQIICHKVYYQHQCVSSLAYHSLFPYRRESTNNKVQLWKGRLEQGEVEGNHRRCPVEGYSRVWVTRGSMEEYSRTFQKGSHKKEMWGHQTSASLVGFFSFNRSSLHFCLLSLLSAVSTKGQSPALRSVDRIRAFNVSIHFSPIICNNEVRLSKMCSQLCFE